MSQFEKNTKESKNHKESAKKKAVKLSSKDQKDKRGGIGVVAQIAD